MEALLLICGVILIIDIVVCILADWITCAELYGGFVKAWKHKRYWKKLHK